MSNRLEELQAANPVYHNALRRKERALDHATAAVGVLRGPMFTENKLREALESARITLRNAQAAIDLALATLEG